MCNDDPTQADQPTQSCATCKPDTTRRDFLKYSIGTVALLSAGCNSSSGPTYRINSTVATTTEKMVSFLYPIEGGLGAADLHNVAKFLKAGNGQWTLVDAQLPIVKRGDLMPDPVAYVANPPAHKHEWLHFFAFTDIHITDKESPAQLIYLQQSDDFHQTDTSIYSPVMLYTTHVLDAAIQTVNALHKAKPMDFGISLGDTCNCTQYNELRWYIDVIDGRFIQPSSGAHLGAWSIDYQTPYQAAGIDKSIPWYQALGNHDHFFLGSIPVDAEPSLGVRDAFLAKTPWTVNDLDPNWANVPVIFNRDGLKTAPLAYCGVLDGSTKYGTIIDCGPTTDPAYAKGPPQVAADPNRRSLLRTEWIEEFFKTRTSPVGHGFDLVPASMRAQGFACYSFVPKPGVPLKVIVLDDTQSEHDGSKDVHGHGYLDAERWAWLQAELAAGQAENQLMIIAAHIPIAVVGIGGETEWWLGEEQTATEYRNAVSLADLVTTLQQSTNLIMWIAGHRHLNVVKAFPSDDRANFPERGFWQVETSSLRDFPQQFRTFEVFLNSDYTVSVEAVNVDPAVKHGSPAEISRRYAVAAQQLVKSDLLLNTNNTVYAFGNTMEGVVDVPVPSMDPTRLQDNSTDLSIQWVDLGAAGVPYNASYNAELYKPLSAAMTEALRVLFP